MRQARYMLGTLLVASLALGAAPSAAQQPSEADLKKLERSIQERRAREEALQEEQTRIRGEIEDLRARMIAAAKSVQSHEAAVTALEGEIAILEESRSEARRDLIARHGQLGATVGALHRMARRPQEAVLALPVPPEDAIRAAVVLRGTVPRLKRESTALREEVDVLAEARAKVDGRRAELAGAARSLDRERVQLAALVDRRRSAMDRAAEDERRVAGEIGSMASRAQSLRELLERLDAERRAREIAREAARRAEEARRLARREDDAARAAAGHATEDARRAARRQLEAQADEPIRLAGLADVRGRLIVPVQGTIARRFGEGSGVMSQGVAFTARPSAQVVAPYDGRVSYAGEFRGYGLLLIIEHGDGYHSLLTGLSRLDVVPGQWLLAGEPVGVMGGSETEAPELYVEIRRRGQPVNPLPWLAVDRG